MPFREVGKACFLVFWRMEKHAFQYFGGWKSMLSSILEDGKACFTVFWRMEKQIIFSNLVNRKKDIFRR